MKTQIFQNWFKLMIGTSALIVSVSFLIRSISPVYATNPIPTNVAGTNGYTENGIVYFISNGYMYKVKVGQFERAFNDNVPWSRIIFGKSESPYGDNTHDGQPYWWDSKKIE